ncbi:MAG: type IV toxin-antitoxin system AbiEi family antitoxin domain-containing protein [Acidimicrobiales bacterium]
MSDVTPVEQAVGVSKDDGVARFAERQHGLVTRDQARRCGVTDNEIADRLAAGRWVAVRRAVYLINGTPLSWEQSVRAACLATGDVAMASGLTAGRLWGLRLPDPIDIDLTTPIGMRVRLEGVRQHRRSNLFLDDRGHCRGVPVTTPARTLVDVSGAVPVAELGRAVDDALRRRVVALVDLRACHQRLDTGPGRRPTQAMRRVLGERAPGHDPGGSDRELWVKQVLVSAGLRSPVQQHRVRIGSHTYKLDLAYPPEMVGLEFDGWDTHRGFSAFHGDRERTRILVAHGWSILPVTSRTRASDLVADVSLALALSGQLRGA